MNTWQVQINPDGNLMIKGVNKTVGTIDLFGKYQYEYTLCVDRHNLRDLKNYLTNAFPKVKILNKETMEAVIKEQFFSHRDLSSFRAFLETVEIPFRYHNNVA